MCTQFTQCIGHSLQALFECCVNLLQSFGLGLSGAAASLVAWQVRLLGLGLRLLLHRRVPHEGVTPAHTHTHKIVNTLEGSPMACFSSRVQHNLLFAVQWFKAGNTLCLTTFTKLSQNKQDKGDHLDLNINFSDAYSYSHLHNNTSQIKYLFPQYFQIARSEGYPQ